MQCHQLAVQLASAVAGVLWTAVSPAVAFGYLTAWMLVALTGFALTTHGTTD
jgi:hypothetical protein